MRFKIDKIDGTTNCEFFAEFSGVEFEAKTKKDAYHYQIVPKSPWLQPWGAVKSKTYSAGPTAPSRMPEES